MTISTHNGSQIARDHNIRNRKITDKEKHIDAEGIHETWVDTPIREAYKTIFDDALREYNEKKIASGHKELVISDYFQNIKDHKQKHVAYEMIATIGSYKEHPDEPLSREILKEFCDSWAKRNPNLIMIGCYYHADEEASKASKEGLNTPQGHVHIDYIPVAYGLKRGMSVQNALNKALEQQGFETKSKNQTSQIAWEKAENAYLEQICRKHGLEIEHPDIKHKKHLNMREFRQMKRIEELEQQNKDLQERIDQLISQHDTIIDDIEELEVATVERANEILAEYKHQVYHREGKEWDLDL